MWKYLSKTEALREFNGWNERETPKYDCEGQMLELREELLSADKIVKNLKGMNKSKKDYLYDLRFGVELYTILRDNYKMSTRDASNDEIWIYLSMKVIPDIVYRRWGLSDTRYFNQSRRIWLKTLWWYIHLSWNDSKEETLNLLKDFTTDEIVQLVERSGPNGYRVDVTREIMKQFGNNKIENLNRGLFRRVMKLNTARVKTVEPVLTTGGPKKYVEELISYFEELERN